MIANRAARELASELWYLFDAGRFRDALLIAVRELRGALAEHPGAHPQPGETSLPSTNTIRGTWRCTVRRIEECAGGVVTVTEISDDRTTLFAVSFFEVHDDRIICAEEYFGDNGPPPFDRSAWTERY